MELGIAMSYRHAHRVSRYTACVICKILRCVSTNVNGLKRLGGHWNRPPARHATCRSAKRDRGSAETTVVSTSHGDG